jgi:hypothetical protein
MDTARMFHVIVLGGFAIAAGAGGGVAACNTTMRGEGPPPPLREGPPPPTAFATETASAPSASAVQVVADAGRPFHREGPPPAHR